MGPVCIQAVPCNLLPHSAWHLGSRIWVSSEEAVPSDHSNIPGRPPPTLYHHASLLPLQTLPLTLCNTNYTNIAIVQAALVSSV